MGRLLIRDFVSFDTLELQIFSFFLSVYVSEFFKGIFHFSKFTEIGLNLFRITPCNGVYICRVCRDVPWSLLCCFQSFSIHAFQRTPAPAPHSPTPPPLLPLFSLFLLLPLLPFTSGMRVLA